MALKIRWTKEAISTYFNSLDYLKENWSEKEVDNFIKRVRKVISYISIQPYQYKAHSPNSIRKALVTKQCSLFFLVKQTEILLITFWDNRQNPLRLKF